MARKGRRKEKYKRVRQQGTEIFFLESRLGKSVAPDRSLFKIEKLAKYLRFANRYQGQDGGELV